MYVFVCVGGDQDWAHISYAFVCAKLGKEVQINPKNQKEYNCNQKDCSFTEPNI